VELLREWEIQEAKGFGDKILITRMEGKQVLKDPHLTPFLGGQI